jgi:aryl-alcohol dehydrogenase-like predicted oxidoreductase
MQLRTIGRSGLKVPPLCFGGNVLGWTVSQDQAGGLLDALVDAGLNFIDTADVYSRWLPGHSGGESETILGHWLKARGGRDKVVIATKLGMDMGGERKGLSARYIRQAVEDSLRRLQTDYIDLYQAHKDDPDTPMTETLQAFGDLIAQGKVRAIGASNFTAERLQDALDASVTETLPRYECLQPHYNLYARHDFEAGLQDVCLANDIGVIPYFSLASGFLTGKYRRPEDLTGARGGMVGAMLNPRGLRILEALDAVAAAHGANPAQVALAWLMARPSIAAPIASATSLKQLGDLIAATRLELTAADIAQLDQASVEP